MNGITTRQLLTMKIHIVDSNWSTEGLRAMLAAVIASFDDAEREAILRAERLASRLHAKDVRSGGRPYVNHLLRVAIRVAHYYHVRDIDVLTAALLHDAVEDHPDELADLATDAERAEGQTAAALAVLGRAFSPRMGRLVSAVTNPDIDKALTLAERQELYRLHVVESLDREPWARVIKLSDFTDNGVGIMWTLTHDKAKRLAAKYAPLVPQMLDFAQRSDTPLDFEAKSRILGQLRNAEKNFAAILDEGE
ncbi:MAG TPA: HD domain-containing protein [Actinospica sp.]|nr:HD domain-containing protein [Actinospica sp.]